MSTRNFLSRYVILFSVFVAPFFSCACPNSPTHPLWWQAEPTSGCPEPLDPANNRYAPQVIPRGTPTPTTIAQTPQLLWHRAKLPCADHFYYRRFPIPEAAIIGDLMNTRGFIQSSAVVYDPQRGKDILVLQMMDQIPSTEPFFEEFGNSILGPIAILDTETGDELACIDVNTETTNHTSNVGELNIFPKGELQVIADPLEFYIGYTQVFKEYRGDALRTFKGFGVLRANEQGVQQSRFWPEFAGTNAILSDRGLLMASITEQGHTFPENIAFSAISFATPKPSFAWHMPTSATIFATPPGSQEEIKNGAVLKAKQTNIVQAILFSDRLPPEQSVRFYEMDSCGRDIHLRETAPTDWLFSSDVAYQIRIDELTLRHPDFIPSETIQQKQNTDCALSFVQTHDNYIVCGGFQPHFYATNRVQNDFSVDLRSQVAAAGVDVLNTSPFAADLYSSSGDYIHIFGDTTEFWLLSYNHLTEHTSVSPLGAQRNGFYAADDAFLYRNFSYLTRSGTIIFHDRDEIFAIQTPFGGLAPTKYPRGRLGGNDNRGYARVEE